MCVDRMMQGRVIQLHHDLKGSGEWGLSDQTLYWNVITKRRNKTWLNILGLQRNYNWWKNFNQQQKVAENLILLKKVKGALIGMCYHIEKQEKKSGGGSGKAGSGNSAGSNYRAPRKWERTVGYVPQLGKEGALCCSSLVLGCLCASMLSVKCL